MQLYLDTSALVKLVVAEPESRSLQQFLSEQRTDTRFTAGLARTELVRAVGRDGGAEAIGHARRILARLDVIALTNEVLDSAATLPPPHLRSLDSIHLAAALTAPALRALVTYDERLAEAAMHAGVQVASPR